jgi:transposase
MPRTMLNDEHWSKLSVIMLKDRVYNKPTHRNTLEGILYRMRTGCPWRDVSHSRLVIGVPYIGALIYGQRKVF